MNLFDLALTYVHGLDPVLDDMNRKGVRICKEAQLRLRSTLEARIQELLEKAQNVPEEVKPTRLWKKLPKDVLVQEVWIPGMVKVCGKCFESIKGKGDHQKGKQNPCRGATVDKVPGQIKAWIEVLPFNPLSGKQLLAYLKHFKHPVGKAIKTGEDSVDKRQLAKLIKKYGDTHPVYKIVSDIRGVRKVLSGNLYEPDENGYAHGRYKHTPSTLRLAQANYNFMQVSHRSGAPYATEIREQIIPSPGCVFVEADYSALEAVLVGHFMGDQGFIDLAKKGIHSYLCCKEFGWEFTPDNAKKAKKEHYDIYNRAKITVYLSLYQGGPGMLAGTFPDEYSWSTFADAFLDKHPECGCGKSASKVLAKTGAYDPHTKRIRPLIMVSHCENCFLKIPSKFRAKWSAMAIADWEQTKFVNEFPALPTWWHSTKELAQRQGYLQSPWGFRGYFHNVLRKNEEGQLVDGEDANAAVNFQPQHAGGMIGRETILLFGQTWLRQYMPANGFIHDGWVFDVPEARKSECIELVEKIMPRKIPQLNNLRIGCEISVGTANWSKMETVKVVSV